MEKAEFPVGSEQYAALGLVSNPFRSSAWNPSDYMGTELLSHAAASRLLVAIDESLKSAKTEPIWAFGEQDTYEYFGRLAVSEVLYATTHSEPFNVLAINVPFPLLSIGRIRSALGILAERLAGTSFDETLGRYAASALGEFDTALPEAAPLNAADVDEFRARFGSEPAATVAEVFGECVREREAETDQIVAMREVAMRQDMQPVDPDESDEGAETDPTTESGVVDADVATDAVDEAADDTPSREALMRDYLVAHARAHLSPVVARGILGYVAHGTDRLAQELKVTKAPRKTMRALCTLATCRFRGLAVIYDDFDSWPAVPHDLRAQIAASMSELRWALKPMAVLAFVAAKGQVPELEEQFSTREVDWSVLPEATTVGQGGAMDETAIRTLVARCALPAGVAPALLERLVALGTEAGEDLERFVLAAGRLVDDEARAARP